MTLSPLHTAIAGALLLTTQAALAAPPADWNELPATDITLFYPASRRWNGSPRAPNTAAPAP